MGNLGSVGSLGGLPVGMNERRAGTTGSWRAATLPAFGFAATVGLKSVCAELFTSVRVRGGLRLLKAIGSVTG